MFQPTRVIAAGALAASLFLAGCAGPTMLTRPWASLRSSSKPDKSSEKSMAIKNPKTGPIDDIPPAASVGLQAPAKK